jgi:hypothetical protein
VAALFDDAVAGYLNAIDAFVVASAQPTLPKIKEAVGRAIPVAEQADRTYDSAVAALKAEQKRVGLTMEAP